MKRLFLFFATIFFALTASAQRIRIIETDSVTYFIDTQEFSSNWGGASYTGTQHVGTNTYAYSQSDGYTNTKKIVAALGEGSYPAYRCDTMVLDNRNDWYLPSGDESKLIYASLNSLRVFPQGWYWTSTDHELKSYDNFWTYDAWAWKKWFGGGEGDIYELSLKTDIYSSFCILKERKTITGISEVEKNKLDNQYFKLYDLNGKESKQIFNKILIKKYLDGRVEKVIYKD